MKIERGMDVTPINWNIDDIVAYGERNGNKYYFDDESGLGNSSYVNVVPISDDYWYREDFDIELWLNPYIVVNHKIETFSWLDFTH